MADVPTVPELDLAFRYFSRRYPSAARGLDTWSSRLGVALSDDYGTRAYQPGDDRRRIRWHESARLGRLMVEQVRRATPGPPLVALAAGEEGYADPNSWALARGAAAVLLALSVQQYRWAELVFGRDHKKFAALGAIHEHAARLQLLSADQRTARDSYLGQVRPSDRLIVHIAGRPGRWHAFAENFPSCPILALCADVSGPRRLVVEEGIGAELSMRDIDDLGRLLRSGGML